MQFRVDGPVVRQPLPFAGIRLQIRLHRRVTHGFQTTVQPGVQFGLADRFGAHYLTLRNRARGGSCSARRSASRARASRDITVPGGISRIVATSA